MQNINKLREKNIYGISASATGKRIEELMNLNGFSIRDISQLMNTSYQAVRKWIRGESMPEISNLYILSKYLGVTVDSILVPMNYDEKDLFKDSDIRRIMSYHFRIVRMIELQVK